MSVVGGDPDNPLSLQARIRAAEAAVARRDATFLREFDTMSSDLRQAGRKGLGWLAGGGAVAGVLLLIVALRPAGFGRRLRAQSPPAGAHERATAHRSRSAGWLAAALPIAMSMLAQGRYAPPAAWRLPGTAGLVWSLVQRMGGGQRPASWSRTAAGSPPHTVATLDLDRYAGAWFEYARLPTDSQAPFASDVTAHYSPGRDGMLRVLNRCIDGAGVLRDMRGVGRPGGAPGRLDVTFVPAWLHWLPFVWSPYWVLDLDADYRHAVVGTPDRRHLWLLSRTPVIERATLQRMVELAEAEGFDIDRLRRTPQRGRGAD